MESGVPAAACSASSARMAQAISSRPLEATAIFTFMRMACSVRCVADVSESATVAGRIEMSPRSRMRQRPSAASSSIRFVIETSSPLSSVGSRRRFSSDRIGWTQWVCPYEGRTNLRNGPEEDGTAGDAEGCRSGVVPGGCEVRARIYWASAPSIRGLGSFCPPSSDQRREERSAARRSSARSTSAGQRKAHSLLRQTAVEGYEEHHERREHTYRARSDGAYVLAEEWLVGPGHQVRG